MSLHEELFKISKDYSMQFFSLYRFRRHNPKLKRMEVLYDCKFMIDHSNCGDIRAVTLQEVYDYVQSKLEGSEESEMRRYTVLPEEFQDDEIADEDLL